MLGYVLAAGAGFLLGKRIAEGEPQAEESLDLGELYSQLVNSNISLRKWAKAAEVDPRRLDEYLNNDDTEALDDTDEEQLIEAAHELLARKRSRRG